MKKLSSKTTSIAKNYSLHSKIFKYIETINGGFNEGELVTICTKFGNGQTSLAVEITSNWIKQDLNTLYVSAEETEQEIAKRLHKTMEPIDVWSIDEKLWFESEKLDIISLEKDISESKAKFVIIDNLQGLDGTKNKIGSALKKIAIKYKCVIFAMSQINKLKDPIMTDVASLSKNDTLLNESDQIWITTTSGLKNDDGTEFVIFNIVKNRKGNIGKTWLAFNKGLYYNVAKKHLKEQIDIDYIDYINEHYPRWYDKVVDALDSINSACSKNGDVEVDDRPRLILKNGIIV